MRDYKPVPDAERCKKEVGHSFGVTTEWARCERRAKLDGYCKQHHPDEEKRRLEESSARYQAESDARIARATAPLKRIADLEAENVRLRTALDAANYQIDLNDTDLAGLRAERNTLRSALEDCLQSAIKAYPFTGDDQAAVEAARAALSQAEPQEGHKRPDGKMCNHPESRHLSGPHPLMGIGYPWGCSDCWLEDGSPIIGPYIHAWPTEEPALSPRQPTERPTRWHEGMRYWQADLADKPHLCWAYVGEETVCIQPLGHDGNAHEPDFRERTPE